MVAMLWILSPTDSPAQPASDEQQIRRARAEFNAAIARHDVPAILTFLEEDFRASVSSGEFLNNRQEVATAFATRFPEFKDAVYVRTPDAVEVSANGLYGSEAGKWVGTWSTPVGGFAPAGATRPTGASPQAGGCSTPSCTSRYSARERAASKWRRQRAGMTPNDR